MNLKNLKFNLRRALAFTLIEMLVVIAIIGLLAAVALPHLGGFGKSNSMTSATKQLLDDVAFARQKALQNRSTVYMVFLPPTFWGPPNDNAFITLVSKQDIGMNQISNLFTGQYTMYTLLSLRTVGDQPGKSYAKYLMPWRRLPEGVTIAQEKFYRQMVVDDPPASRSYRINPFATNLPVNIYPGFPFPSVEAMPPNTKRLDLFRLPYIAFTPNGSLLPTNVQTNQDEFIPLTRASVIYPLDQNGTPKMTQADWVETPPGSSTNDYHLIHINWLTGRAKLERKEILQ